MDYQYVPYVADAEAWKKHFVNYRPSTPKRVYTLKDTKHLGGKQSYTTPTLEIVSPTEQFVEQAKAQLRKEFENENNEKPVNTLKVKTESAVKTGRVKKSVKTGKVKKHKKMADWQVNWEDDRS
jgi:hypothetical protein